MEYLLLSGTPTFAASTQDISAWPGSVASEAMLAGPTSTVINRKRSSETDTAASEHRKRQQTQTLVSVKEAY